MSTIPDLSPESCAEGVTGHWQLQRIVDELRAARDDWRTSNGRISGEKGGRELPSRSGSTKRKFSGRK